MVNIKKLRSNFEVRFNYIESLINYLKTIPKEQCLTKMNTLAVGDGTFKKDWYKLVNESGLEKILKFCKENEIAYKFDNVNQENSDILINKLNDHQIQKEESVNFKNLDIKTNTYDYSFMKIEPYPYQKEADMFFELCKGNAILGDQPGVGKSVVPMIYAIRNKLKTLVIVPASLKLNWKNEILKFTNEKCFIFKFKPRKKDNIVTYSKEESLFHVINYETLETYFDFDYSHKCTNYNCKWEEITNIKKYETCPKCNRLKTIKSRTHHLISKTDKTGEVLNASDYDLVVLDEAHYIKNSSTIRTQIIKKAFKESSKKILMTGTAIKNRPYEFFNLLNMVDPKEWSNIHNFGIRYCKGHQDDFGHWKYDGYSNLEELYNRIAPYFLRRLKKDVLKFLPPKTYTTIPIELTPDKAREYKQIEEDMLKEAEETDTKISHLARIQKLKQFTSHYNAKCSLEFIQNILDGDEKIVVFSQFISTTHMIYEHFKKDAVIFTGQHSMVEKQQAVDRFMNDPNCKVFAATIGSAGVGLTLTSASCLMFIDLPWEPASKIQAEDRIHRASQTADNIQIIKLICQNTYDVDIDKLITEKEKIISQVLDGEVIENEVALSIFDDLTKIILERKKKII